MTAYLVTVTCKSCGIRWEKYKHGTYGWSGLCKKCAAINRKRIIKNVEAVCKSCGVKNLLPYNVFCIWSGFCKKCRPPIREKVNCKDCGKELLKTRQHLKTWEGRCRSCAYKERFKNPIYRQNQSDRCKGEKSNFWKGGISTESLIARKNKEYRDWRRFVFERDNYTCRACNERGGSLHAHHIYEFSKYHDMRYDKNNGVTLCQNCHTNLHADLKRLK